MLQVLADSITWNFFDIIFQSNKITNLSLPLSVPIVFYLVILFEKKFKPPLWHTRLLALPEHTAPLSRAWKMLTRWVVAHLIIKPHPLDYTGKKIRRITAGG